ncbi:hypothetical protein BEQ56_00725 [Anaerolineaceae bacterium oral taxon 439]|nr:hypothetical protein BEQ56_00725 [Anaerolineaceae bacterium oral taxon 439]
MTRGRYNDHGKRFNLRRISHRPGTRKTKGDPNSGDGPRRIDREVIVRSGDQPGRFWPAGNGTSFKIFKEAIALTFG